jgi:hypothetical protein
MAQLHGGTRRNRWGCNYSCLATGFERATLSHSGHLLLSDNEGGFYPEVAVSRQRPKRLKGWIPALQV